METQELARLGTEGLGKEEHRGHGVRNAEVRRGYTPVAMERVRKPLKIGGMAARGCAKECVIA
jgi:hypothetical protein